MIFKNIAIYFIAIDGILSQNAFIAAIQFISFEGYFTILEGLPPTYHGVAVSFGLEILGCPLIIDRFVYADGFVNFITGEGIAVIAKF